MIFLSICVGICNRKKGSADFLFLFWVDYSFGLSPKKIKIGIPERVSKEVSSRRVQQLCVVFVGLRNDGWRTETCRGGYVCKRSNAQGWRRLVQCLLCCECFVSSVFVNCFRCCYSSLLLY